MISTHILDTTLGRPASDVAVSLFYQNQLIAQAKTNADGRISATDFGLSALQQGEYHLEFATQAYFDQLSTSTFFPKAVIYFQIDQLDSHYHIPLLISAFAYSTYRGS